MKKLLFKIHKISKKISQYVFFNFSYCTYFQFNKKKYFGRKAEKAKCFFRVFNYFFIAYFYCFFIINLSFKEIFNIC